MEIVAKFNGMALIVCIAIGAFCSLVGGVCKGICDSIAHHDKFKDNVPSFMKKWSGRDMYFNGKYYFMLKYRWWTRDSILFTKNILKRRLTIVLGKQIKIYIVENIIVIFLDAWHLSTFLDMIFDALAYTVILWLFTGYFLWPFILCFVVFQIGFRTFYK